MTDAPRVLELLAPAKDADTAIAAIECGADAVYIGPPDHGARAAVPNSIEDIQRVCQYAHLFGARVYVTVNTLVYDDEVDTVQRMIRQLWRIGVDGLIVQEMGMLRMSLPPIDLHASTQCDIRTPAKARFLAEMGFSQLVIPRETTLSEIKQYAEAIGGIARIESFVHGALCVSYSGDCQASWAATGRSANRGRCAQICRLAFDLVDGDGKTVIKNRHLLSLKDLNRLENIPAMIEAGVDSFKVEGRLKDIEYVRTVTAAYSQCLNTIIAASDGNLRRSSVGDVQLGFNPDPARVFNRGFTPYFLTKQPTAKMSTPLTPKAIGMEVGKTTGAVAGNSFRANLYVPLNNGDGIGFFDSTGKFSGFRVNRVEGNTIYTPEPVHIPANTRLYRNFDKSASDAIKTARTQRVIGATLTLRLGAGMRPVIDATDATGISVSVLDPTTLQPAKTPRPANHVQRVLSKSGNTVFRVDKVVDMIPETLFLPASMLAELRRRALDTLARARRLTHQTPFRRPENKDMPYPEGTVDYHANVANRAAEQFYKSHGAAVKEQALEIADKSAARGCRVMTSRYCLRRELGACLCQPDAKRLKAPLSLRAPGITLQLDFDCSNCQMYCIYQKNQ